MDAASPIPTARAEAVVTGSRVRPSRRIADRILVVSSTLATAIGIVVLGSILLMLIVEGVQGFSPMLFTEPTPGPGSVGGGIANAILGSLVLTGIGIVIATPIGLMAGTYLAEYGRTSKLADIIRFLNDILLSAPSILIGLFVYTLMVRPFGDVFRLGRRRRAGHHRHCPSSCGPPRTCCAWCRARCARPAPRSAHRPPS